MLQKLYAFFRKETVLSIAVILALLSMFWVRPNKAYFTYIDFRTLGLLFCLMAIVAGLKAVGVFDILAQKLLMGTSGYYFKKPVIAQFLWQFMHNDQCKRNKSNQCHIIGDHH